MNTNKYVEKKGKKEKKERIDKQSKIEVDKEDLYILKINCKGKRTVGKANKGINVEKLITGLKNLRLKLKKKENPKNLHNKSKNKNNKCFS